MALKILDQLGHKAEKCSLMPKSRQSLSTNLIAQLGKVGALGQCKPNSSGTCVGLANVLYDEFHERKSDSTKLRSVRMSAPTVKV